MVEETAGLKNEKILSWVVMFQTPMGLVDNLPLARDICIKNDFNPQFNIIPVPVAVTETAYELVVR